MADRGSDVATGRDPGPGPRPRLDAVDALRGLALAAMVIFHLTWDLHAFGLTRVDPARSWAWWLFGRSVAAAFLALSGIGLVLARQRGSRWPDALRRIGVIAAAAGAVTIATAIASPGETVWFGILHCIAGCDALALPLLKLGRRGVLAAALAAVTLPVVAAGTLPDGLWWTGLASSVPNTLDYQPVFPSLGFVALGIWVGRSRAMEALRQVPAPRFVAARLLCGAGRHSLSVYLIHQPVLFAALYAATALIGTATPFDDAFVAQCRPSCIAHGQAAGVCDALCRCVANRFREAERNATESDRLRAITACTAAGG